MPNLSKEAFVTLATQAGAQSSATLAIPLSLRLLSDQLTPVLAYRRLVVTDQREAPRFLLESVQGGERQGRYSILGAQPIAEVIAFAHETQVRLPPRRGEGRGGVGASPFPHVPTESPPHSPFDTLRALTAHLHLIPAPQLPHCVLAGRFGHAGYDTVRYAEPQKLHFEIAPRDDRGLPDLHFAFYDGVVIFDHVDKLTHIVQLAFIAPGADPGAAYDAALAKLNARLAQ